jgi:large-conductance mechanosensitive channel
MLEQIIIKAVLVSQLVIFCLYVFIKWVNVAIKEERENHLKRKQTEKEELENKIIQTIKDQISNKNNIE